MGLFDRFNPLERLYDVALGQAVRAERTRMDGVIVEGHATLRRKGALMFLEGAVFDHEQNKQVGFTAQRQWFKDRDIRVTFGGSSRGGEGPVKTDGADVDVKGKLRASGLKCIVFVEWHDGNRRRRITLRFPV